MRRSLRDPSKGRHSRHRRPGKLSRSRSRRIRSANLSRRLHNERRPLEACGLRWEGSQLDQSLGLRDRQSHLSHYKWLLMEKMLKHFVIARWLQTESLLVGARSRVRNVHPALSRQNLRSKLDTQATKRLSRYASRVWKLVRAPSLTGKRQSRNSPLSEQAALGRECTK
jgi:hypothetical protein